MFLSEIGQLYAYISSCILKLKSVNIGSIYAFNVLKRQPKSKQMFTLCSKPHFSRLMNKRNVRLSICS